MIKNKYYNKHESGVALVFAIGLLGLMLVVGLAFLSNALIFKNVAKNTSSRTQARMLVLSAANRAAASVMAYQLQCDVGESPDSFDEIHSYGETDGDTDGLKKKANSSSKMLLPEDGSVVEKAFAVSHNAAFKGDGAWDGSWVYFYNKKSGDDREIVGRAAWQVVTSNAQILAPVFLRGEVSGIDSDSGFLAGDHRWGRDIDEVSLSPNLFNEAVVKNLTPGTRIDTFEKMFSYLSSSDTGTQTWIKTWLIPDFTDEQNYGTVKNPMPIFPEVYVYQEQENGPKRQVLRFNISEGDYSGDKWYGRFAASGDKNSAAAINKLTQDGVFYIPSGKGEVKKDKDLGSELPGLPFLRRIGDRTRDSNISFRNPETAELDDAGLAAWRRQIAANFNDYCDSDSIPTSDVAADQWITPFTGDFSADISSYVPKFTGNEKTPYLYEFGMNFGIVPTDSESTDVKAKLNAGSGRYDLDLRLQAIPLLKLANIYDFNPDEAFTAGDSNEFMRGYLDFGKTELVVVPKSITLKNVSFSFEETVNDVKYTRTAKADIKITDVKAFKSALASDLTLTPGSEVWKNKDGGTEPVAVPFAKDKLKNQDGNNPYPLFVSENHDDKYWQFLTLAAADVSFALTLDDFNDSGSFPAENIVKIENFSTEGTEDITNVASFKNALVNKSYSIAISNPAEEVVVNEIILKKVTFTPRRLVLQAETDGKKVGVDFAGYFGQITWNSPDVDDDASSLKLFKDTANPTLQGMLIGGMRNYDPRQNLYGVDWQTSDIKCAKLADFKTPAFDEIKEVAAVVENAGSITGKVNGADGTAFCPKNTGNNAFDCEPVAEPAFNSSQSGDNKRLSTAYIRNAPMMSPWEIGLIHRGVRWQTLNIKLAGNPGNSADFSLTSLAPVSDGSGQDNVADWAQSGTSYVDGDGALLEQIKMTDRLESYGKININQIGKNDLDRYIVQALFGNIIYNQSVGDFIKESTRASGGGYPGVNNPNEVSIQSGYDTAFSSIKTAGKQFVCRAAFLNCSSGSNSLENGFGTATGVDNNDAAQEEIIGKTINLLSAGTSPAVVQVVIIAQSIQDRKGVQVRASSVTGKIDGLDVDDGAITKTNCKLGEFDIAEHSTNDDLNVYFDEITGEVKALVTFVRDPNTGRLFINRIDYLSD